MKFASTNGIEIKISEELVNRIRDLDTRYPHRFCVDEAIFWVTLHEKAHQEMGHFELLEGVPTLSLVATSSHQSRPVISLPQTVWPMVDRCIELQADHEAIDELIKYSDKVRWEKLRRTISSVSAVMVLMSKTEDQNAVCNNTHPLAATRIFQLLGHVTEMWSINASLQNESLPPFDEVLTFGRRVILPAYWDVIEMACSIEAMSISSDLGDPEDFFSDVMCAKLGNWDELKTSGAKEWAELKDVNELILPKVRKFQAENSTSM